MKLTNIILTLLLLTGQSVYAKGTLKYLLVDTLIFERSISKEKHPGHDDKMEVFVKSPGLWIDTSYTITPGKLTILNFPDADSLQLGLIIDDAGSTIRINNVEKLGDTIHLRTWTIFHNDLPDTVWRSKSYFHYDQDTIYHVYKRRKSVSISGSGVNVHHNVGFILNNTPYNISIKPSSESQLGSDTIYHGYPRKRDRRKEEKDRKHNRFVGSILERKTNYTGYLNL